MPTFTNVKLDDSLLSNGKVQNKTDRLRLGLSVQRVVFDFVMEICICHVGGSQFLGLKSTL